MAVVAGVAAAYLTLFELGRGRQGHVDALGVLASLLAILCWSVERLAVRRTQGEWREVFVVPVRNATICAGDPGVPFEWDAPGPLLLASVPFLLLIKTLPAGRMAVSRSCSRGAFGNVHGPGPPGMAGPPALGGCGGVRLLGAGADPLAVGVAASAGSSDCSTIGGMNTLRIMRRWHSDRRRSGCGSTRFCGSGSPWSAQPWVPAGLAILALLMLKPYPHRGWVDGFVGSVELAVISLCQPGLDSPMAWALGALALALLWRIVQWAAAPAQEMACHRLGIAFVDLGEIVSEWSIGLLAIGALPHVAAHYRGSPGCGVWDGPIPCRRLLRSSGGKACWRFCCSGRTWTCRRAPRWAKVSGSSPA